MKTNILSVCALLVAASAIAETPAPLLMEHVIIGSVHPIPPKPGQSIVSRASILEKPIQLKLDIFPLAAAEGAVEAYIKKAPPLPQPPARRGGFLDAPGEGYRVMSGELRR